MGIFAAGKDDFGGTWLRFTVSGRPCRRGTFCQENRETGYWSCELEFGEDRAWDYCCRPGHQCGFSEGSFLKYNLTLQKNINPIYFVFVIGFNYPWCYVGSQRDQWRPCSERYYPYGPGSGNGRPPGGVGPGGVGPGGVGPGGIGPGGPGGNYPYGPPR